MTTRQTPDAVREREILIEKLREVEALEDSNMKRHAHAIRTFAKEAADYLAALDSRAGNAREADRYTQGYAQGQADAAQLHQWMQDKAWQDTVLMLVHYQTLAERTWLVGHEAATEKLAEWWRHARALSETKSVEDIAATPVLAVDAASTSTAIDALVTERARQINREGWTPEHDDQHADGALALAAACYAASGAGRKIEQSPWWDVWPWDLSDYKPGDPRRDLVRAGALIVAEIERLDRKSPSRVNATTAITPDYRALLEDALPCVDDIAFADRKAADLADRIREALAASASTTFAVGNASIREKLQQVWDLTSSLPPLIFSESEADYLISVILNAAAAAPKEASAPAVDAVPAGWQLVPIEPTRAMLNAAAVADDGSQAHYLDAYRDTWVAMLAALSHGEGR
jgi:hypothetical protein